MTRPKAKRAIETAAAAVAVLWAVIIMAACSRVPSGVIPPKRMANLMADIYVGEAVVDQGAAGFRSDSMLQVLKLSIYKRNGVTAEEFDSSMMWYGRNLETYSEVCDKTIEILEKRISKASQHSATTLEVKELVPFEAEGDSVDIWNLYRTRVFSPTMPDDRIAFHLNSDRYWEAGDVYRLRFRAVETTQPMVATIVAEYTDGTAAYVADTPVGDGWHELALKLDADRNASSIYGYLAAPDAAAALPLPAVTAVVDSVSLVRMRSSRATGVYTPTPKEIRLR